MKTARPLLTVFLVVITFAFAGCTGSQPSLKDAFKNDFLIGMALNDDVVSGKDPQATSIVERHCNTITPENVMKWQLIHPEPNRYDFEAADRFVAFGQKNEMFIVSHTLVWHWQTPGWVFEDDANRPMSRDAMLARLKDHIFTVMGRYKGKVNGWDVVNEALDEDGQLRKTKWLETIGEDFIARAFEYAHEADPDAELYYNDFNIDRPGKLEGCVRLIKDLKQQGLRVDGVGLQEHSDMNYPSEAELEGFFKAMRPLGVKIMITELDVSVLPMFDWFRKMDFNDANVRAGLNPYPDGLPDEMQKKLADRYAKLFTIYRRHADVIDRVTFWGVYDETSWLNFGPFGGRKNYPLLFGRDYQPKPAFFAVIKTAEGK